MSSSPFEFDFLFVTLLCDTCDDDRLRDSSSARTMYNKYKVVLKTLQNFH